MKLCWGTQEIHRPCWGILQDAREMIEPLYLLGTVGAAEIIRLYAEDTTANCGKMPLILDLLGDISLSRLKL